MNRLLIKGLIPCDVGGVFLIWLLERADGRPAC